MPVAAGGREVSCDMTVREAMSGLMAAGGMVTTGGMYGAVGWPEASIESFYDEAPYAREEMELPISGPIGPEPYEPVLEDRPRHAAPTASMRAA